MSDAPDRIYRHRITGRMRRAGPSDSADEYIRADIAQKRIAELEARNDALSDALERDSCFVDAPKKEREG